MKTKTNLLIKLAVITCLTVFFSCKKKDTTVAPAPTTPMGTLAFHLHTNIDTTETDSGRICKDAGGRRFQLNVAQFYASGIVAIRSDGSKVPLSNVYILKTMAKEEYVIGSIPAGNYNSVSSMWELIQPPIKRRLHRMRRPVSWGRKYQTCGLAQPHKGTFL